MVNPQGPIFWLGLGALLALMLNSAALLLPVGLIGSPFHAWTAAMALGWLGVAGGWLRQEGRTLTMASMLLLGLQLLGYACGWAHVVAASGILGIPVWALTAAHPLIRLPGLGMGLPLGSLAGVALAILLALADVASPGDPLAHWGWIHAWGLTVFCVAWWHWWASELPRDHLYRAEVVLLGWVGAVLVIPVRLSVLPAMPAEHFGALAGVVDTTTIALLFASAWAARQVAATSPLNERNPP